MSVTSPPESAILSPESDHPTKVTVGTRGVRHQITAVDLFLFSAWCGLASGLLEVGTKVLCRAVDPSQRLYLMSQHFVWLAPLSSLLLFLVMGLVLSVAVKLSPRRSDGLALG